ncbi:MAG TPA: M61 family peptidase [Terriglobales bacterium]|nr:M61 family peptidase [Terriglobales bacterium]
MKKPVFRFLLFVCATLASISGLAQKQPPLIAIKVDATDITRRILHAEMTIPANPGALTLYYPKWIPGEHGPTGPIQELTGLHFRANGQELKWRRDLLDAWTFHIDVPAGVSSVQASLDYVSLSDKAGEGIYTGGASATAKMTVVSWNTVLLYPAGFTSDSLKYEASLRLPAGWKYGTSLEGKESGGEIKFSPVSLTMLVDSPVIAGEYLRVVPLAENPRTEMDIAADSPAALEAPDYVWQQYKQLVEQAQKLFGAHHYRDYHFLYSLSDHVAHFGLEHHESDDSRVGEHALVNDTERLIAAGLLPHEYVHSWNGKYRRPADLSTPDYQKPMQDDLLWVYEGLTSYLGDVLSGRSGLRNADQFRDSIALLAADLEMTTGRSWRNLQDTADGVPAMQGAPHAWETWRRDLDYYDEDVLNWLWVDVIIRQQSQGKKSIDDFCKLFHGGQSGPPMLKTYTFDDVVNALNQVVPYDWRGFWTDRLTNHGPGAPVQGLELSGWKLAYDESPSELLRAREADDKRVNAQYSLGLLLGEDGEVIDTVEGMLAAKAAIGPGMRLLAINGRRFTGEVLREALRAGKNSSGPLELLVENSDYFKTYKIDYHEGEKYPHLVRNQSPDLLEDIIRPR